MVSKSPSNAALRSSFSFFFDVIETTLATCNDCGEPPPQPRVQRPSSSRSRWSAPPALASAFRSGREPPLFTMRKEGLGQTDITVVKKTPEVFPGCRSKPVDIPHT